MFFLKKLLPASNAIGFSPILAIKGGRVGAGVPKVRTPAAQPSMISGAKESVIQVKAQERIVSTTPAEGTDAGHVLERFGQLPEYLSVLTHGVDAIYPIAQEWASRLIALDIGGRRAIVLRAVMSSSELQALHPHAKALQGNLLAKGFRITEWLVAQPNVLRDTLRNAGRVPRATSIGEPLRLFERWLELGIQFGATDIHIDVNGNVAQIRTRVDGSLEPLADGHAGLYTRKDAIDALAAGYHSTRKGNNNSQFDEEKFVDCMLDVHLRNVSAQVRYQSQKGRLGPKVVLRILRCGENSSITFESAGYAASHLKLLRDAARVGKGLVLIAGETGSGKSTSLKCFIETLPYLARKAIYTVEDPIEYEIKGAHQIEVKRVIDDDEETNRRYAEVMRSILRSDPDGVMVGEMRDTLTATFLLQVGETGHLAMATVHAHLLCNIIPRLTNDQIGLSRQALTGPNILNLLVYQALVPKLCSVCAETTDVAIQTHAEIREIEALVRAKFKVPTERLRWQRVGGCPACKGRGTQGKTIVAEMFQPDRVWLTGVRNKADHEALMHYRSFSDGDYLSGDMTGKTVFEHALWKALQGSIDIRCCEEFESLNRYECLEKLS